MTKYQNIACKWYQHSDDSRIPKQVFMYTLGDLGNGGRINFHESGTSLWLNPGRRRRWLLLTESKINTNGYLLAFISKSKSQNRIQLNWLWWESTALHTSRNLWPLLLLTRASEKKKQQTTVYSPYGLFQN